ncbi:hypothetical protein E2562_000001 [Oryza meyeriana var. granulata]|uniref:Uncharacterized protein n=1 Tax=Oryza meyeriana var. granulata TaxID=110450 RepID=A0A6G1DBG9_9ORYZ|nr:hypothetical protein E2562_000001 [Oryza meyeriana var. granulata]
MSSWRRGLNENKGDNKSRRHDAHWGRAVQIELDQCGSGQRIVKSSAGRISLFRKHTRLTRWDRS